VHVLITVPSILAKGFGALALMSAVTVLGAAAGRTGDGARRGSTRSSPQARASTDRTLAAKARSIDRASVGETHVAKFLGAEFGMSEEAIVTEKNDLGASWGNLTIAFTLAASDKQGMTPAQILDLHERGMGWGQVAAGLGFNLDDAVRAVNAESRVARGRTKADGKAAPIGRD
jgi:hypothetical protein